MTRVVIVDDQQLLREGFRLILERAGMVVAGEAADGVEAVDVCRAERPDVVLMDVRMPRLDGIEATRRIVAAQPEVRVMMLTTFDLDDYVYAAVHAGASGFLLKDVSPQDLVHAVQVVARGEAMLAPGPTRRLLARFAAAPPNAETPRPDVTERECAVLRLVAKGLSNTEIAAELFLSEATVKTYVSRLLTKLSLRDRVQLAVLAYECGLVRAGGQT
ncbi:LuxR family transcriptional regulator [Intrasporangium chromatireducens Q5-1]|uniref:LuxR family transcriptional regulator n=1 Tax=Intrasporangium chromatireducens Q5-1 TaxID=584657 RepID=W9GSA6_9MICO|nr:response regulator transcription factor [Intrasporangium chromatireducens]EWT07957.1 LuxR family transcriptional regulator [Intrasporangium chromatireducens Q5-1]